MSSVLEARRLRLRPLLLGTAAAAAIAVTGCGEKSEPTVQPPVTAAATTTAPAPTTTTQPAKTPTAPVPKTTP